MVETAVGRLVCGKTVGNLTGVAVGLVDDDNVDGILVGIPTVWLCSGAVVDGDMRGDSV